MVSAEWLGLAVTGDVPRFQPEFRLAAPDGCLPHRLDEPEGPHGLLRDQALAIEATLIEYRLSGAPPLLPWAERAASFCIQHLWDESAGAFRAALDARGVRLPPIFPLVANGEMAMALIDLAAHAGRPEYRRCAERLVQTLGPQALGSPAGPAVALAAQRLTDKAAEADLYGDPGDGRARDLARIAIGALGPAAVLRWKGGAEPSVALCVRDLCLPPIEDPRDLCQSLIDLELAPGGILIELLGEPKP